MNEPSNHYHDHGKEVLADLVPIGRELKALIPDVYDAFAALSKSAQTPGALDAKTKELIAMAIAINSHCDGCIASHGLGMIARTCMRTDACTRRLNGVFALDTLFACMPMFSPFFCDTAPHDGSTCTNTRVWTCPRMYVICADFA